METNIYIVWMIMYDYKLNKYTADYWRDGIPVWLTIRLWKAAESRLSPLDRYYLEDSKLLRALVTSPRREERSDIETGPFVDSRLRFEKERILSRGNEFDRIDSRFKLWYVCARTIYLRKGQYGFQACSGNCANTRN